MSACLKLDQESTPGYTAVPNELYRRLEEAHLHPMAQLLIFLLTRHTYGWHQVRAYRPVAQLLERMGCDPRTFRLAREQAVEAGFLEWGKEFCGGVCRTWWMLRVPAACCAPARDQECKNAPYQKCKNALSHVTKEKDQRKHHQQADVAAQNDQTENDDDLQIDQTESPDRGQPQPIGAESGSPHPETTLPPIGLVPTNGASIEITSGAEALKVSPAGGGLLDELRSWGVNGRIAARIVETQPAEKLVRALRTIKERPNVRNPAGWLVAECAAAEAYSLPGSTRAALLQEQAAELRKARRAEELASKEAEMAENDRHLEFVGRLVAELTPDERAELEEQARQRVRRLSSKAGSSPDCPILLAEFRNLVLERKSPKPSLHCADGSRWAEFRVRDRQADRMACGERLNRDCSGT
ncbi:MAG: hypothetical protein CMLOHMNK_03341 [Steroidobacteraceae bacterium]|nr:hypothetical protein [Steroidobacteraceae bacterium]